MAEDKTGSTKDKAPIILLKWNFEFWDVRKTSDSFGDKTLTGGGYGKEGDAAVSDVSVAGGGDTVKVPFRKKKNIGLLTFDHKDKTVDLMLGVPPAHDSGKEANPASDSPKDSAKWNSWCQVQMRGVTFPKLAVDADGYFKVTGGRFLVEGEDAETEDGATFSIKKAKYDLVTAHVDPTDAAEGLAPNGYMKIHPRKHSKKDKQDVQVVEVDWLFDVFRPTEARKFLYGKSKNHYKKKLFPDLKKGQELTEEQRKKLAAAEREDKDKKKSEWQVERVYDRGKFTDPFLVLHVTGKSGLTSQLQQLTSWAAIHYMVCWNGHAIKVVEDEKGCYHAGWSTPRAGWRDYKWGRSFKANQTAIGIEHLAQAGADWPKEQENGSVRLIRAICKHHTIPACSVIRHRDLALDIANVEEVEAAKKKGKEKQVRKVYQHVVGKECPGSAIPWNRYQDEKLVIWPLGFGPGEAAPKFPEGDDFFHGIFELESITYIEDKLTGADDTPENQAKRKDAIWELKEYLEQIGYWVIWPRRKDEKTWDDYDKATRAAVTMCQEKFMSMRGSDPKEPGKVDRETARVLWAVCQHQDDKILPALQTR